MGNAKQRSHAVSRSALPCIGPNPGEPSQKDVPSSHRKPWSQVTRPRGRLDGRWYRFRIMNCSTPSPRPGGTSAWQIAIASSHRTASTQVTRPRRGLGERWTRARRRYTDAVDLSGLRWRRVRPRRSARRSWRVRRRSSESVNADVQGAVDGGTASISTVLSLACGGVERLYAGRSSLRDVVQNSPNVTTPDRAAATDWAR